LRAAVRCVEAAKGEELDNLFLSGTPAQLLSDTEDLSVAEGDEGAHPAATRLLNVDEDHREPSDGERDEPVWREEEEDLGVDRPKKEEDSADRKHAEDGTGDKP